MHRLFASTSRYSGNKLKAMLKQGLWKGIRKSYRFQSSEEICLQWIVLEICRQPTFIESAFLLGFGSKVKVWSWIPKGDAVQADIDVWSPKDPMKNKMVKAVAGSPKSDQISVEISHWEKKQRKRAPRHTARVVKIQAPGNMHYFEIRGRRKG